MTASRGGPPSQRRHGAAHWPGLIAVTCLAAACSSRGGALPGAAASRSLSTHPSALRSGATLGSGSASSSGLSSSVGAMGPYPAIASESATVTPQGKPRTQGHPPSFTRLASAAIVGLGAEVRISATFDGVLPARLSDRYYYMIVSWNIAGDAHHQTVGLSAQATSKGWSVAAGNNNGTVAYPGRLAVDGDSVVLTFPWSLLGGAHAFDWSASASWFDTGPGAGGYSEQSIPQASYPGPSR